MDFRLLGPLEIHEEGRVLEIGGQKRRALLALLLVHANEVVSSDRLIEELWGEAPPRAATTALQGHVSRLRKLLRNGKAGQMLITRPPGYVLQLGPDQLDLHRFERLREEGRKALREGDQAEAGRLLDEALALWRGPALADLAYEPFARAEAARLEELRLATLEERIDADLALGRHADLVAELEILTVEHPFREGVRGRLMLALYRSGRQAEALDAYQQARRALVEELGIEPSQPLRELEQAILRQDSALDLASARPELVGSSGPVFVGRKHELEQLLLGLGEAVNGRGGLYLLVGEPGIGKSRLAEELIDHAKARGARVLVGRCWEAGGAPAFWPWVQSFRGYVREREPEELRAEIGPAAGDLVQILPDLRERLQDIPEPSSPDSEGARFRLFDAVTSFLKTAGQKLPLVVVLDDLHAADEPSLLLLQFLARELGDSRLLVVGAYRDVDPTLRDPLMSTLAELARERVTHRIVLEGLDKPAVSEYIERAAGHASADSLVAAIHAETGGNPLFVGEVVRLLATEGSFELDELEAIGVPEGIRQVISRRLHHLSDECYGTLTLAAVLGREFDLDSLERLSGTERDHLLELLDEAITARVASEVPGAFGRLRFEHALIRDTVYESVTLARRGRLHRRAGEALEELYADAPEAHLAELAHHFFAALPGGDSEKAERYAVQAAERSVGQLAFEEAARLYEMALTVVGDDVTRCELLLALGTAHARAGDTPASKRAFTQAAELADALQLPEQLGRAAFGYGGRILWEVSRDDRQLASLIERALAAIGDEESQLRVRLLARLACGPLRAAGFPPELKLARSEEAVEIARRIGDPATLAYALHGYTQAHLSPDRYADMLPVAEECVAVALAAGDKELAVEAHEQLFLQLLGLGDAAAARASLHAMAKYAQELRQPPQLWLVAVDNALFALLEGRFGDAEQLIQETLEFADLAPRWNTRMSYRLQIYALRRAQGRLGEVVEALEATPEELDYRTYPIVDCVLAQAYDELGRREDARATFERLATNGFAAIPFDEEWLVSVGLLAEVAHSLGDRTGAEALYRRLAPYSDQLAVAYPEISTGSVSRYLGLLAGVLSRWDEAERHFEQAAAVHARIGAHPWLAHTRDDHAQLLLTRRRPGDRERAQQLLDQALEVYRRLGMTSYADRISALS